MERRATRVAGANMAATPTAFAPRSRSARATRGKSTRSTPAAGKVRPIVPARSTPSRPAPVVRSRIRRRCASMPKVRARALGRVRRTEAKSTGSGSAARGRRAIRVARQRGRRSAPPAIKMVRPAAGTAAAGASSWAPTKAAITANGRFTRTTRARARSRWHVHSPSPTPRPTRTLRSMDREGTRRAMSRLRRLRVATVRLPKRAPHQEDSWWRSG